MRAPSPPRSPSPPAHQSRDAHNTSWCKLPWQRWHCVHNRLNLASCSFTVASRARYISASLWGGARLDG